MIAVFGIFFDRTLAEQSVTRLTAHSFATQNVTLLDPNELGSKDLSHDREATAGNSTAVVTSSVAAGGALGLVAGIGLLAIPGAGPILAAGPLLGAIAGMAAGGAVGGAIDAVDAVGPPDHDATRYVGRIPEGGILVTVHCQTADETARARELLTQTGATAISSSDEPIAEFEANNPLV